MMFLQYGCKGTFPLSGGRRKKKCFSIEAHSAGMDPYQVIGLDRSASDGQVKKRYRELMFKLHPDTAATKGTEFLFKLVMAAYQQISQERGWRK